MESGLGELRGEERHFPVKTGSKPKSSFNGALPYCPELTQNLRYARYIEVSMKLIVFPAWTEEYDNYKNYRSRLPFIMSCTPSDLV